MNVTEIQYKPNIIKDEKMEASHLFNLGSAVVLCWFVINILLKYEEITFSDISFNWIYILYLIAFVVVWTCITSKLDKTYKVTKVE